MVAVAFVLFRLIADNESGKADARLARRPRARRSTSTARTTTAANRGGASRSAATWRWRRRCARTTRQALQARLDVLLKQENVRRIVDRARRPGARRVGQRDARSSRPSRDLVGRRATRSFGTLQVSVQEPAIYTRPALARHGLRGGRAAGRRPRAGGVAAGRRPRRDPVRPRRASRSAASAIARPAFDGARLPRRGRSRSPCSRPGDGVRGRAQTAACWSAGILAGFFVLAFTFALLVSRSLQRQIDAFLHAARRLGAGDFTVEVPTEGHDEFAALGEEFNKMSRQLEERAGGAQPASARACRTRCAASASRSPRTSTATACWRSWSDRGRRRRRRRRPRLGAAERRARRSSRSRSTGDVDGLEEAVRAAEAQVLETGEPCEAHRRRRRARSSHPLRRGDDATRACSGVVSVARRDRPFTDGRARAVRLPGRAGRGRRSRTSDLHETVERQAVTDELTGLFNRRRFQEAHGDRGRARQALRPAGGPRACSTSTTSRRVNDTYGHQQGDLVLREVAARAARDLARDRRAGALRRRGAGGGAARHRPRGRLQPRRARARRRSRSWTCRCSTASGTLRRDRELRRRDAAGLAPTTCASSWRRPTTRSTGPSAPARTARCGLRPHPGCSRGLRR